MCVETSNEQKHGKSTLFEVHLPSIDYCIRNMFRFLHPKCSNCYIKIVLNQYNIRHFFEQKCYYHKCYLDIIASLNSFDLKINKLTSH
jgi:hypothetical protein